MPSSVSRDALRAWFSPRVTTRSALVGAEYEMLTIDLRAKREAPYTGERGVEAALHRLLANGRGWTKVEEGGHLIALSRADGSTVTLEPGGQLEFSTAPRGNALEIDRDLRAFVAEFDTTVAGMDLALSGVGVNPFSATRDVELGPKKRYRIMTDYLSKTGDLALDMMRRTCSVHCSFDFFDEADGVEKSRVAFAATPIVTAIFAHSPFEKLAPNGFQSFRAEIWRRTDPARCGLIPEVFEPDFSLERYVDVVLRLPLIFTLRNGEYREAHGLPAAKWFAGELPEAMRAAHAGITPVPDDIEWVINQSFRDARLRRYLECRASDFPPAAMATAPVALWTGLMYDAPARAGVWELMRGLDLAARQQLAGDVAKHGLRAKAGGREVLAIARDLLALAKRGLVTRGFGEESLLAPVEENLARGQSPADRLLEKWPVRADADGLIAALRF